MSAALDRLSENIASPFTFFIKKGAFALLVGILLSTILYSRIRNVYGSYPDVLLQLLAPGAHWQLVLGLISGTWLVLLLLFLLTPLKKINHPVVNIIAALILAVMLFYVNRTVAVVLFAVFLLLLLYKGYRGNAVDYDFTFNPYGDARWASYYQLYQKQMVNAAIAEEERDFSYILGKVIDDKPGDTIRFSGEGHVLTVAKTGAGKGISVVIPNLLSYKGSTVIIDPKGENFLKTHYHRENGFDDKNNEICLIDPFREVSRQIQRKIGQIRSGQVKAEEGYLAYLETLEPRCATYGPGNYLQGFNPMQLINNLHDEGRYDEIYDEANVLADMLVVKTAGESDPHWNEKARSFIRGAILFVTFSNIYEGIPKDLVTVRNCIFYFFKAPARVPQPVADGAEDEDDFGVVDNMRMFIEECENPEHDYHPYLRGVAGEVSIIAGDERNSVLSSVLRHTEFLDSPMVAASVTRDDCRTDDIKRNYKTIYLVLPANKLNSYSRLSRLWINCVIQSLAADVEVSRNRVLFMLDEMAQLGYMEPLVQAVSLMRGYGMNLWMIFQDLPQIKSIYGEKWQTFVANSRIQQFFGVTDNDSTEYVSKLLGQTTMTLRSDTGTTGSSKSKTGNSTSESHSQSISHAGKPLLYPDQVRRMPYQIIIADGINPVKAGRITYFEDPEMRMYALFPKNPLL